MCLGNFYPNASQLEKYICRLILTAHRDNTHYLIYTGVSQPRRSAVNPLKNLKLFPEMKLFIISPKRLPLSVSDDGYKHTRSFPPDWLASNLARSVKIYALFK